MEFNIKQARNYSGETQKEMAKKLGVALPTYRDYEHGKIVMRVDKAKSLLRLLKYQLKIFLLLRNYTNQLVKLRNM